ncbi:hypothetical protein [Roseomonas elaeocarpi]|uniref:Uncharacterized protein n=1 Tax=Roseomonas elaeocarpi TaxID=907779 RepID=A0ABV6JQD6_9PROT
MTTTPLTPNEGAPWSGAEDLAAAWAEIDGRAEAFEQCRADPKLDATLGYYSGRVADAEGLIDALAGRGVVLTKVTDRDALQQRVREAEAEIERLRTAFGTARDSLQALLDASRPPQTKGTP